jgi:hypothetical protein
LCTSLSVAYIDSGFEWFLHQHSGIQFGRTALISAAQGGFVECVRLLVDFGADTEAVDNVR